MGVAPTVWMQSLRWHTYLGKPQAEGDIYLAHEDQVENIENLKFAVRDFQPPKAQRAPVMPPATPTQPATVAAPVAPMTTSTFTVGNVQHGKK